MSCESIRLKKIYTVRCFFLLYYTCTINGRACKYARISKVKDKNRSSDFHERYKLSHRSMYLKEAINGLCYTFEHGAFRFASFQS